ncbi:hypothetical protein Tco_0667865 [Tanacetum coccineum]
MPTEMELTLEQTQQGVSYEVSVFTMKMEIRLEPTSNKLMLERFNTTAGNPVKKILLKLNLSDHRSILTDLKAIQDGGGVNESQERCSIKAFQINKSRMMLKITMSNTSSRNKLNPEINDHYNIFTGECQKDELKTKDKACMFVVYNPMRDHEAILDNNDHTDVAGIHHVFGEWGMFHYEESKCHRFTVHVCNSRDMFVDYQPVTGHEVVLKNNSPVDVVGFGTVTTVKVLTLENAFHMP